ncbi:MAG TPA: FliH/SctL family protein [Patescibacteria group bacterium]|nr:FliH/SctL family protein [Patescibacteria group bacterium]
MADFFIEVPKRLKRVEIFHAEDSPAFQSAVFKDLSFEEEAHETIELLPEENAIVHDEVIPLEQAQQEVQKAYEQGFNDGQQVATATMQVEIQRYQQWVESFDAMAVDMRRQFGESFKSLETSAVALAVEIAQFVIGRELQCTPDLVIQQVQKALAQMHGIESVRIRMNPADVEVARNARAAIQQHNPDVRDLLFVEDEAVRRGGCIVETSIGMIDAQIRTQLEKIRSAMQDEALKDSRSSTT